MEQESGWGVVPVGMDILFVVGGSGSHRQWGAGAPGSHRHCTGRLLWSVLLAGLLAVLSCLPVPARAADGADGVILTINQNIDDTYAAFKANDASGFAANLHLLKANLTNAAYVATVIVQERQTNPAYVPAALKAIPVELTPAYYMQTVPQQQEKLKQMAQQIVEAEKLLKKQQLKGSITVLLAAIQTYVDAVGSVSKNPLTVVMGAKDTLENSKTNATYISNNLAAQSDIEKTIAVIKQEKAVLEKQLLESKEYWEKVNELWPVFEEVWLHHQAVKGYISTGVGLPVPPPAQPQFVAAGYIQQLAQVEGALAVGKLSWAEAEEMGEETYDKALDDYSGIPAPTPDDKSQWALFQAAWSGFLADLKAQRAADIATAQALGAEWRVALIAALTPWMAMEFGGQLELYDCSYDDIEEVLPELAVKSYDALPDDPQKQRALVLQFLSRTTGPLVVPSSAQDGAAAFLQHVGAYPDRLHSLLADYRKATSWQRASASYETWRERSSEQKFSSSRQVLSQSAAMSVPMRANAPLAHSPIGPGSKPSSRWRSRPLNLLRGPNCVIARNCSIHVFGPAAAQKGPARI